MLFAPIAKWLDALPALDSQTDLPADRQAKLNKLATYLTESLQDGKVAHLNFICTHNSRRSVLGQMLTAALAHHMGIGPVVTYSGGTEVTACHPNTIAALEQIGFKVSNDGAAANPRYSIIFSDDAPAVSVWSKVFDDAANPAADFAAVLVCSSAAEECPFVPGASLRLPLAYEDPKRGDGTPEQNASYQEAATIIATEMRYALQQVLAQTAKA